MDLLKILRSVEELLFELISWLVFYPRTLWKTLTHPLQTMAYSDREQADKPDQQYLDTLSPPLFLVLSIGLAHGIEVLAGLNLPPLHNAVAQGLLSSNQNLLIFRALMFSLHPLLFAVIWLHASGRRLDRETLRAPFFAQCYLSGATSILVGLASTGVRYPSEVLTLVGVVLILTSTVWYVAVQYHWLSQVQGMGRAKAVLWACSGFLISTGLVLAISYLLS